MIPNFLRADIKNIEGNIIIINTPKNPPVNPTTIYIYDSKSNINIFIIYTTIHMDMNVQGIIVIRVAKNVDLDSFYC